jgi:hypothetical protein
MRRTPLAWQKNRFVPRTPRTSLGTWKSERFTMLHSDTFRLLRGGPPPAETVVELDFLKERPTGIEPA